MAQELDFDTLEKRLLGCEQADCPVEHIFAPGLYIRQVTLPKGVMAIGHRHLHQHWNVMLEGAVMVPGGKIMRAPLSFLGEPGRKIGFMLERVVWQNLFPNPDNCQDIETLERRWLDVSRNLEDAKQREIQKLLSDSQQSGDRADFKEAVKEMGFTEEEVWCQSTMESDLRDLPPGRYKFKTATSPIHGTGVFAVNRIQPGEVIGPGTLNGGGRTVLGRYVNHAKSPNAAFWIEGGELILVAIKPIHGMRGGFDGEEITVDYRQSVKVTRKFYRKEEQVLCLA